MPLPGVWGELPRICLLRRWVNSANVALANLSRWCTGVRAEHVSDGPRRTHPPRSTFRWMVLHSARISIQGNPIEGGLT
jgi:hypothetical protein